jgi:pyruvate dehydrogenase E2 component (dihydrolipoamide acetyltransferase)
MAIAIKMPRLSDTMQEGNIKSWSKKVGDTVKPGDILAEVETDKATMDLEAYQDGVLLYIAVAEGPVPVDGLIAIIGSKGEDFSSLLNTPNQQAGENTSTEVNTKDQITALPGSTENMPAGPADELRIKASPLAKFLAKEKGISLETVSGSGEQGRIVKKDIENISAQTAIPDSTNLSTAPISTLGDRVVQLSQIRKTIARRLSESKFSAPHFYLTSEIDMDKCIEARTQLNNVGEVKLSFNDLIVKACALAIRKNLGVNVSWMGDKMIYHNDIHIGIAVAIEEGLVVPVIPHADRKSLTALKTEIQDKAGRAKDRKLTLDEMQGNTFTISNLGMFDIEHFTAIINPPDACILAIGSILKQAVVKNDTIVISNRMKVTLSCDHRAVDGATGAKFLQTLKLILENPISMLL